MPVTFVNQVSAYNFAGSDTVAITPGAGSDFQVGAYIFGPSALQTATFAGDAMAAIDGDASLYFAQSARILGLAGDYTGSSRDLVFSGTVQWRAAAAFGGASPSAPILHTATRVQVSSASDISITISGANNPTGSRIVWLAVSASNYTEPASVNVGDIHAEPDDFGARNGALGSVAGTGSEQTITFTRPSGTSDMTMYAFVIAEAVSLDTLTIDSQPSTATSGAPMGTVVVESSDTASTATVTATIASGSGSLSGTTSGAMVAGEITFSNLIITGTGAHTLAFNATGHDEVISSTITVSEPPAPPRVLISFRPPA
jgi:hypothetical protein